MNHLQVVLTIAGKELMESLRSRWFIAIMAILVVLGFTITAYAIHRSADTINFGTIIASLVNLVIYLIPMFGLLLSCNAIAGENEHGSLAVLLTQPLRKRDVLFGKYLGLAAVQVSATTIGLGLAGILLLFRIGLEGGVTFLYFLLTANGLGLIFLSIGLALSAGTKNGTGATIGAMAVWFIAVFLFDAGMLGVFILASTETDAGWLQALLYINPVDLFRLSNIMAMPELRTSLGLTNMTSSTLSTPEAVSVLFVLWIAVPLFVAHRLFIRREPR